MNERVEKKPKMKGKWVTRDREKERTERKKVEKNFRQAGLEIQHTFQQEPGRGDA